MRIPPVGKYLIDVQHSTIAFETRHVFGLGAVRGTFALRAGDIQVAEPVGGSSATATIAADSFASGNKTRNKTVLSPQYLNAQQYPDITFRSTGFEQSGDVWTLHGTLTVREVSRPIDLKIESAEVEGGTVRVVATTEIDRYEFDITAQKGMTARRLTLRLDIAAIAE